MDLVERDIHIYHLHPDIGVQDILRAEREIDDLYHKNYLGTSGVNIEGGSLKNIHKVVKSVHKFLKGAEHQKPSVLLGNLENLAAFTNRYGKYIPGLRKYIPIVAKIAEPTFRMARKGMEALGHGFEYGDDTVYSSDSDSESEDDSSIDVMGGDMDSDSDSGSDSDTDSDSDASDDEKEEALDTDDEVEDAKEDADDRHRVSLYGKDINHLARLKDRNSDFDEYINRPYQEGGAFSADWIKYFKDKNRADKLYRNLMTRREIYVNDSA